MGIRGLGWVVRNERGEIIKAGCKTTREERDMTYLEMLAIREDMQTIQDKNCYYRHLEPNSLQTIRF